MFLQDREFLISVVGKTSLSSIINLSLSINSLSEILLYGTGAGTGVLVRYRTSPAGTTVQQSTDCLLVVAGGHIIRL